MGARLKKFKKEAKLFLKIATVTTLAFSGILGSCNLITHYNDQWNQEQRPKEIRKNKLSRKFSSKILGEDICADRQDRLLHVTDSTGKHTILQDGQTWADGNLQARLSTFKVISKNLMGVVATGSYTTEPDINDLMIKFTVPFCDP